MSRLLVGRSLRGGSLLMAAVALGCGIQREGEAMDPPEAEAPGSGGHGTAGTLGSGGNGVAGVFGLGGASNNGGMSGSAGNAGFAGGIGTAGNGGTGGSGGFGGDAGGSGDPIDAGPRDGNDASNDALSKDALVTDVIDDAPIDVSQDAALDTALIDAGARDAEASVAADAKSDVCVPTGTEVCDGIDNNCNGSVDEQTACPAGCIGVTHLGQGYMVCYTQPRWKTWPDAEADCVSRGMHLVRVNDAAENQWIVDTMASAGYSGGVWIGANDRQTEGVWVWTDGVQFWQGEGDAGGPIGGLYNDWGRGQPNDNAVGGEDCAELGFTGSWIWNDLSCDTFTRAYVCER
jgi:hypothetical protein